MSKRKKNLDPWEIRNERKRKVNKIPRRKRYLICTEGKTEAVHLDHYKSYTGPIVVTLNKSAHKERLVNLTIKERDRRIKNGEFDEKIDEAWVVFDRDAQPSNKKDKTHFNQAIDLAEANNLFIAYSNDAFEIWYVLHFQDLQTPTHRNQLSEMLTKHTKGKHVKPYENLYKDIQSSRSIAIQRAKNLLKSGKHPESANPSTTVHLLIVKLMNEPGYREES